MADNQTILTSLLKFHDALGRYGDATFDPYDLMASPTGQYLRSLYFKSKPLGMLLGGPYFMADLLFPNIRRLISTKKRYANADAHLIMGYLDLFRVTQNQLFLDTAARLGDHLLSISIEGFSGHCWGYPFDWVSQSGTWKQGTPFITVTPYCYEAFIKLYEATQKQQYADIALSVTEFVANDLKEYRADPQTLICSYSPFDNTRVINANAYRSFVLVHASAFFNIPGYREKAAGHIRFVRSNQQENGSWFYESGNAYNTFIDNIHTCFVLKNLIKCNQVLKSPEIHDTIVKGLEYYLKFLVTDEFSLRPFARSNKFNFFRESIYDYAEAINLLNLSRNFDPRYESILNQLVNKALSYQHRGGSFTDRITMLKTRQTIPFIRWGQSQMFSSLSSLALNPASYPLNNEPHPSA